MIKRHELLGISLGMALIGIGASQSGCSMTAMAADTTVDIMTAGKPAFDRESDLHLARAGAEANIMMMEGLTVTVPGNADLWQLLAEAYTGYAFGFVEDDLEALSEDDDAYEATLARAYGFYVRGRDAALHKLNEDHGGLPDFLTAGNASIAEALSDMDKDDVPALYWLAQSWSSMVNLHQDDPGHLLHLERIQAVMDRVMELDERYFDGGPHLFFGVLKSAAPQALSDQSEEAAAHFAKAWKISGEKNLMVKALQARFLRVAAQDRAAFEADLQAVLDAPDDLSRRHNLVNALAKRRASKWLAKAGEYFPEG